MSIFRDWHWRRARLCGVYSEFEACHRLSSYKGALVVKIISINHVAVR